MSKSGLSHILGVRQDDPLEHDKKTSQFLFYSYTCIETNTELNLIYYMNQYPMSVSGPFPVLCHPKVGGEVSPHRVDDSDTSTYVLPFNILQHISLYAQLIKWIFSLYCLYLTKLTLIKKKHTHTHFKISAKKISLDTILI